MHYLFASCLIYFRTNKSLPIVLVGSWPEGESENNFILVDTHEATWKPVKLVIRRQSESYSLLDPVTSINSDCPSTTWRILGNIICQGHLSWIGKKINGKRNLILQ